MWNKSSQTSGLECWHSWSSSNLWGLGSETDPFCMGRQQALAGNKKRNSQKIIGGRGLLRRRVATRIHIVNSIRALQSIAVFLEWPSWEREEINATHTCTCSETICCWSFLSMLWSACVELVLPFLWFYFADKLECLFWKVAFFVSIEGCRFLDLGGFFFELCLRACLASPQFNQERWPSKAGPIERKEG